MTDPAPCRPPNQADTVSSLQHETSTTGGMGLKPTSADGMIPTTGNPIALIVSLIYTQILVMFKPMSNAPQAAWV